jgi:hypothetical protein
METKHTPGPWRILPRNQRLRSRGFVPGFDVQQVVPDGLGDFICDKVTEADAYLIAAAPDMLAALLAVLDGGYYDDGGDYVLPHAEWNGSGDPPDTSDNPALIAVSTAIAKAKGGAA